MVPNIQSLAQMEENYKKTGSEILLDNCQLTIAGGFTPQGNTAELVSRSLGNRTVLSGSVSRGKNDPSQSLQMMERPLMSPDELKVLPKRKFIVTKTGSHPMKTTFELWPGQGHENAGGPGHPERCGPDQPHQAGPGQAHQTLCETLYHRLHPPAATTTGEASFYTLSRHRIFRRADIGFSDLYTSRNPTCRRRENRP